MEGILEHFVHMVLCKCAVVLIKAESMKPSFSDAVRQEKNAETIVSKGNTLPNKDVFKNPRNNRKITLKQNRERLRDVFHSPPVSNSSHRLYR